MICPSTRAAALGQLDGFIAIAGQYGRDRNHVMPGHPAVSRLSPAIRHRLITEEEVAAAVLSAHPFGRVEKFIQEVYWRRYWKSWLALRPEVWSDYQESLAGFGENPAVVRIGEFQTGNQVIDYFAKELVTTGYMHNHARMWFAAWWIHEARLPWQSGAAFFFRHLLDGDPASNTLSWRWVAGLQTPGKTYLTRRGNLEKYLAPELLASFSNSLNKFENPQPLQPETFAKPPITHPVSSSDSVNPSMASGLWIHEEDLAAETSSLKEHSFAAVAVTGDADTWERYQFPSAKIRWISDALQDAATRAERVWNAPTTLETTLPHVGTLVRWAGSMNLQQILTMRPEVGPLSDSLPSLRAALAKENIQLALIDRPEDLRVRPFATGGFFQFWERLRKGLVANTQDRGSSPQQILMDFPQ